MLSALQSPDGALTTYTICVPVTFFEQPVWSHAACGRPPLHFASRAAIHARAAKTPNVVAGEVSEVDPGALVRSAQAQHVMGSKRPAAIFLS